MDSNELENYLTAGPLRPGPTLLQLVSKEEFNRRTALSFGGYLRRQPRGRVRESLLEAEVIRAAKQYRGCRRVFLTLGNEVGAWFWQEISMM